MEEQQYKLSRSIRITAGVLAVSSFISLAILVVALDHSDEYFWFGGISCLIAGALFLYAAVKGESPAWLEDPLWFAKFLARRRKPQQEKGSTR